MTTDKKVFYVSFGQRSPFNLGWVEILASGYEEATAEANSIFGQHYSNVYTEEKFDRSFFPSGKLGRTVEGL